MVSLQQQQQIISICIISMLICNPKEPGDKILILTDNPTTLQAIEFIPP